MVRLNWKNVLPIFPSRTGAEIRFKKYGCSNRHFFQIGVAPAGRRDDSLLGGPVPPLSEVIGMYDPMPNERNEKLVTLDMDRFTYWLGQGAKIHPDVQDLLGICGVTPLTPNVLLTAVKKRKQLLEQQQGKEGQQQLNPPSS